MQTQYSQHSSNSATSNIALHPQMTNLPPPNMNENQNGYHKFYSYDQQHLTNITNSGIAAARGGAENEAQYSSPQTLTHHPPFLQFSQFQKYINPHASDFKNWGNILFLYASLLFFFFSNGPDG